MQAPAKPAIVPGFVVGFWRNGCGPDSLVITSCYVPTADRSVFAQRQPHWPLAITHRRQIGDRSQARWHRQLTDGVIITYHRSPPTPETEPTAYPGARVTEGLRSDRDRGAAVGRSGRGRYGRARRPDQHGARGVGRAEAGEPPTAGGPGDPQAGHCLLRVGDPVTVRPFLFRSPTLISDMTESVIHQRLTGRAVPCSPTARPWELSR